MSEIKLSPEQLEIINAKTTKNLVISCPGSGKTTVMVEKIIDLIKSGVNPKEILYLAFTRASVADVKEKLIIRAKQEEEMEDLIKQVSVRTFHSFCIREIMGDVYGADSAIFHTLWKMKKLWPHYKFELKVGKKLNQALHTMSKLRLTELTERIVCDEKGIVGEEVEIRVEEKVKSECENHAKFFEKLLTKPKRMRTNSETREIDTLSVWSKKIYSDFYIPYLACLKDDKRWSDFTGIMYQFIKGEHEIKFHYVFVDELQDIDFLQQKIIEKLLVKNKYFLASGDPNQSIYRWRGAVPDAFGELNQMIKKEYPDDIGVFRLNKNRRSGLEICSFGEGMHSLSSATIRSSMDLATGNPDQDSRVRVWLKNITDLDSREVFEKEVEIFMKDCKQKTCLVLTKTNIDKHNTLKKIKEYPCAKDAEIKDLSSQYDIFSEHLMFQHLFDYIFGIRRSAHFDEMVCFPLGKDEGHENEEWQKIIPNKSQELNKFKNDVKNCRNDKEAINFVSQTLTSIMDGISEEWPWWGVEYQNVRKKTQQKTKKSFSHLVVLNIRQSQYSSPFKIIHKKSLLKVCDETEGKLIMFSTVYCAKGLEADASIVFYGNSEKRQGWCEDVLEDVEFDESVRLDFVAATRARNKLVWIPLPHNRRPDEREEYPMFYTMVKAGAKKGDELYREQTGDDTRCWILGEKSIEQETKE